MSQKSYIVTRYEVPSPGVFVWANDSAGAWQTYAENYYTEFISALGIIADTVFANGYPDFVRLNLIQTGDDVDAGEPVIQIIMDCPILDGPPSNNLSAIDAATKEALVLATLNAFAPGGGLVHKNNVIYMQGENGV